MNAQVESDYSLNADEAQEAPKSKAAKTVVEIVTMEDGRKVEFAGKRKLVKEYFLNDDGTLNYCQFDFRNGVSLKIVPPESLLGQFAGHGVLQKYGDELAGIKGIDGGEPDIDDMVLTLQTLDETIQQGKWSTRKEGDGLGGTSILIKALVEYGGKTVDQVKAFLKDKDAKFKAAIRSEDKRPNKSGLTVAAIVKRLESEKLAKGTKVNTDEALAALDSFE